MDESTVVLVSVIAAFFLLIGGTFAFGFWSSEKTCLESYAAYQPQWGIWSGCRVMWNEKLTPVDIIREIN